MCTNACFRRHAANRVAPACPPDRDVDRMVFLKRHLGLDAPPTEATAP